ncbi:MAG TPA: hypothetical protein VH640_18990 [Bryobacteraceae bacterium]|jgi:predicted nucleic acid-binding protein
MPKPVFNRNLPEVEFLRSYFDQKVLIWVQDVESTVRIAQEQAELCDLRVMDALHVAAAYLGEADVLYTLEKKTKPMYRTELLRVECL